MAIIKIKQVKSGIDRPEVQKRTLRALGFSKMNQVIEALAFENTPVKLALQKIVDSSQIPITIEIDTSLFVSHQDIAVLLSRILISISYAIGGTYALFSKTKI